MADETFDVVIGAGPSGLSCAIAMAKAGLQVAVLERGTFPGSKNVMGGVFYRHPMDTLLPDFWRTAPMERLITEQRFWMLGEHGHVGGGVKSERFAGDPPNCWTVLRAKFDRWLSEQAEAAGVMLLAEATVESLLKDGDKITGVHTNLEDGDLSADVVVIAEGANSLLLRDLGVHGEIKADQVATAVKEVISLPSEKIEDRFNLEPGQGVAIELFGSISQGGVGLGFLYTNRDSLSLGIGVLTSELARLHLKPNDIIEAMKSHPSLRPLLAGGKTEEYAAHLIPEGGFNAIPRVHGAGWVAVGDSAMLVNNVHREGSNLAIKSGLLAAETIIAAKRKGDYSADTLSAYRRALEASFVFQDLRKYRGLPHLLETNPHFFSVYPGLVNDAATEMFTVDGTSKRDKQKKIVRLVKERRGLFRAAWDMVKGGLTVR